MNDMEEKILESLKAKPGQKVREIADELGVDKALVMPCPHCLYQK